MFIIRCVCICTCIFICLRIFQSILLSFMPRNSLMTYRFRGSFESILQQYLKRWNYLLCYVSIDRRKWHDLTSPPGISRWNFPKLRTTEYPMGIANSPTTTLRTSVRLRSLHVTLICAYSCFIDILFEGEKQSKAYSDTIISWINLICLKFER